MVMTSTQMVRLVEQLEERQVMTGDMTFAVVPGLDSSTAFIAEPLQAAPHIVVAGNAASGSSYLAKAPLTRGGELTGDTSIEPSLADAVFGLAEPGIDTRGQQEKVKYIPGASQDGHPALFDLSGALVWSDNSITGKIEILHETPRMLGLIQEVAGGQKLLLAQDLIIDIPQTVQVEALLKPLANETKIYLGGKNTVTDSPTILVYDLEAREFLQPSDIELAPNAIGSVKGLTRSADGRGQPVAVVEAYGLLPGNVPVVGSVWVNDRNKVEVFGPSNGGKVIAQMGVTVYQGEGSEWFVYVGSKTMSNLTGLPRSVPIPLSGILADGGFGDTIVTDVTSVLTDGFGRLYLISDIEVAGEPMTSIASIYERVPLYNKEMPLNTNNDRFISPIDVLLVINHLNSRGSREFDYSIEAVGDNNLRQDDLFYYLDPTGDGYISPLDALVIINELNRRSGGGGGGGGEGEAADFQQVAAQVSSTPERVAQLFSSPGLIDSFQRIADELRQDRSRARGINGNVQQIRGNQDLIKHFQVIFDYYQQKHLANSAGASIYDQPRKENMDALSTILSELEAGSGLLNDEQMIADINRRLRA
jgi:hypothetical protein